ncbi:MAG: hypothetical protein ACE14V_04070 [bacterium]
MKLKISNLTVVISTLFLICLVLCISGTTNSFGVTSTYILATTEDDSYQAQTGGINAYAERYMRCGRFNNTNYAGFMRWKLTDIPKNSHITYAVISVCAFSNTPGNPTLTIWLIDSANCPQYNTSSPYQLGLNPTTVSWAPPAFSATNWYVTSQVSALVQNYVNKSDYTTGNYIGLRIGGGGGGADKYRAIVQYDLTSTTQYTARLVVTFNLAPNAVTLISPLDQSSSLVHAPTFYWNPVTDADGDTPVYQIQIASDSNFVAIETTNTFGTATSWTPIVDLPTGTHYWRVISQDQFLAQNTSAVWKYTCLNRRPPAVNLLQPPDTTVTEDHTPTFIWSMAIDPDGDVVNYLIQVDNNSTFNGLEYQNTLFSTNTEATPLSELATDFYYWRVISFDGSLAQDTSAVWTFSLLNRPPNQPTLLSPLDNSSTMDHDPQFVWTGGDPDPGDIVIYRLEVDDDINFGSPNYSTSWDTTTTAIQGSEFVTGTYYWRIIAQDTSLSENTSATWTVSILNRPPTVVNLIEPNNATNTNDHTPPFIWSTATDPDGNAIEYSLQVDDNSNFSSPEYEVAFGSATESIPVTEIGTGYYYWRVISRDSLGAETTSAVWTLTIMNRAPSAVTLIAPIDSTTTSSHTPTFVWSTATDPDAGDTLEYQVQLATDTEFATPVYTNTFGTATEATPGTDLPTGAFYWRVISRDTSGAQNVSGIWTIAILNRPPEAVTLISPLDASSTNNHLPQFIWSSATDPDPGDILDYQIEIDDNPSFSSPIYQNAFGSVTEATPDSDLPNGTLYWHIISRDTSFATNTSAPWLITFENRVPNPISLITPSINTSNNRTPTFIWAGGDPDPGDVVTYRLQVWADAGFVIDTSFTTDTECLSPITLSANRYNWRVIGEDNSFAAVTSPTSWFIAFDTTQQRRINGVSTAIFYLGTWASSTDYTPVTLSISSVLDIDTVTITVFDERHPAISSYNYLTRWYRIEPLVGNIAEANIRFSYTDADFEDANYGVVPESEIKVAKYDGSWSIPSLTLARDTILNRVDINGVTSFSDWTLMIDNQEPFAVQLIQPENSSTTVNRTPLFAWDTTIDPEGSVVKYRIQVDKHSNFGSPDLETAFSEATEATPTSALTPGVYYWHVICEDTVHAVNTSARWTVTILNQAPDAVTLVQPADSSTGANHTPLFAWNPASDPDSDAVTYRIQVDDDSNFGSPNYVAGFSSATEATPGTELASGTYYWRVISQDAYTAQNTSAVWSIIIENRPPAASTLVQPGDSSNSATHTPLFAWNPAVDPDSDAVTYLVQVDDDINFGSPDFSSGFASVTTATPSSELVTGTYYWRVISQDSYNAQNTSAVWSVILDNQAPNAVNLISPLSGTTTNNRQPTFRWNATTDPDGDAVTYLLQVDNDAGFGSPEFTSGFGTATSAVPSSMLTTGTYYWRVISQDSYTAQNISAVWTLTIRNQAPNAVSLISPVSGTTTSNRQPTFRWNTTTDPDGDTVSYELELSTDAGFGTIAYSSGFSSATSATPTSMVAFGSYYWRVVSQDSYGAENYSAARTITIQGSGTTDAPMYIPSENRVRSSSVEFLLDTDIK